MATKSIASLLGQAMARVSVAETQDYAPMKAGVYKFTVAKSQFKPNKNGTGYLLSLGAKTDKNRWLWHNFNLIHPSAGTQEIAAKQFAGLLKQLGMTTSEFTTPEKFAELEGCEFIAYVNLINGQNNFSNFNQRAPEVKKFQDNFMDDPIAF